MDWPTHPRELGLVTTAEATAPLDEGGLGMTPRALMWAVESARWQRIHRSVYLMRPGGLDWITMAAAALLAYGRDAALCGPSAAVLHGLAPVPPVVLTSAGQGLVSPGITWRQPPDMPLISVVVPRRIRPPTLPGTVVRHSDLARITRLWPARTTFDSTVIDLMATGGPDEITSVLSSVLRSRRTTAPRLLAELDGRSRHPQRGLVRDILSEVAGGCESPLERRFVKDVLAKHRLPRGVPQWSANAITHATGAAQTRPTTASSPDPRARRFDRALPRFRLLFELDGMLWHQGSRRAVDRQKSRLAARGGWLLLRYGWQECVSHSCETAAEIAQELRARGWRGRPHPCCPTCPVRWLSQSVG